MSFVHFETFLFVRKRLLSMQSLILELFTVPLALRITSMGRINHESVGNQAFGLCGTLTQPG